MGAPPAPAPGGRGGAGRGGRGAQSVRARRCVRGVRPAPPAAGQRAVRHWQQNVRPYAQTNVRQHVGAEALSRERTPPQAGSSFARGQCPRARQAEGTRNTRRFVVNDDAPPVMAPAPPTLPPQPPRQPPTRHPARMYSSARVLLPGAARSTPSLQQRPRTSVRVGRPRPAHPVCLPCAHTALAPRDPLPPPCSRVPALCYAAHPQREDLRAAAAAAATQTAGTPQVRRRTRARRATTKMPAPVPVPVPTPVHTQTQEQRVASAQTKKPRAGGAHQPC